MPKKKKKNIKISPIDQELKDYLVEAGMKMLEIASKKVGNRDCKKCGKGNKIKLVPLYNDPYPISTEITSYCDKCRNNESLIIRDEDKRIRNYMRKIQRIVEKANKL